MARWWRRTRATSIDELSEGDRGVLRALTAAGARLTEPRHALFYLWFDDEPAARGAADDATGEGFVASVALASEPPAWVLVCEHPALVTDPPTIARLDRAFRSVAERHGGTYDGWEASV